MIRYMGTKRFLAEPVSDLVARLPGRGRVVDLFCGTGAVTAGFSDVAPVIMNDASAFLGPILRTRFTSVPRVAPHRLADTLRAGFNTRKNQLEDEFHERLQLESYALNSGRWALREYMDSTPHVGSDGSMKSASRIASRRDGPERYCLMTIYFSGGYVSTRQAIALDSLRCAIDHELNGSNGYEQSLAALTVTLDRVLNAPGHSAQFLRPNSAAAFLRIRSTWSRDIWNTFLDALSELEPYGTTSWRSHNEHRQSDALDLVGDPSLQELRAIYADPPYTKDQYSRYYHVHETLHLYDFPSSTGQGRYRGNRFTSQFSAASQVEQAFRKLFQGAATKRVPVVLSYPPDGLLRYKGLDTAQLASDYFSDVNIMSYNTMHSTMGASNGTSTSKKVENIYVCRP